MMNKKLMDCVSTEVWIIALVVRVVKTMAMMESRIAGR